MTSGVGSDARLVAEEFGRAAAEADSGDDEDKAEREEDGVPIEHGVDPTRRVGEILAGPEADEAGDDEALGADDQEQLAAAAAAIERFDFLRGDFNSFLRGDGFVGLVDDVFTAERLVGRAVQFRRSNYG